VLDGVTRTVTRKLETVALRGRPTSDLRLQIVPATPVYGPQRSLGSVTLTAIASSLPIVDATSAASARVAAAPASPAASAGPVVRAPGPLGAGLLGRAAALLTPIGR
jgi:hypothetical protein